MACSELLFGVSVQGLCTGSCCCEPLKRLSFFSEEGRLTVTVFSKAYRGFWPEVVRQFHDQCVTFSKWPKGIIPKLSFVISGNYVTRTPSSSLARSEDCLSLAMIYYRRLTLSLLSRPSFLKMLLVSRTKVALSTISS